MGGPRGQNIAQILVSPGALPNSPTGETSPPKDQCTLIAVVGNKFNQWEFIPDDITVDSGAAETVI